MGSKHQYPTGPQRWAHPADEPEDAPCPEAQLAGEIAARFVEWGGLESRARATQWIVTCAALHAANPLALWLYLGYQSGDSAVIAKTFREIADETASKKQNAHAQHARAFDVMARVLPAVAATMRAVYLQHHCEAGPGNAKVIAAAAREDESDE
jgi:hypothetical protein